jgi:hypothetical protein
MSSGLSVKAVKSVGTERPKNRCTDALNESVKSVNKEGKDEQNRRMCARSGGLQSGL